MSESVTPAQLRDCADEEYELRATCSSEVEKTAWTRRALRGLRSAATAIETLTAERDAATAEADALRKAVEAAPHARHCNHEVHNTTADQVWGRNKCNCWKKLALDNAARLLATQETS